MEGVCVLWRRRRCGRLCARGWAVQRLMFWEVCLAQGPAGVKAAQREGERAKGVSGRDATTLCCYCCCCCCCWQW